MEMKWDDNIFFCTDHGQTKPKPRGSKKTSKLTAVEQEGESRCLFRASRGNKKISTVVWTDWLDQLNITLNFCLSHVAMDKIFVY